MIKSSLLEIPLETVHSRIPMLYLQSPLSRKRNQMKPTVAFSLEGRDQSSLQRGLVVQKVTWHVPQ